MRSSIKLGRIAGIEIGIHYTWVFAFVLIAWSVAQGFLPVQFPGWSTTTYWITGVVTALLLFVSVLLHELAHSLVAKSRGMKVSSITLFIFGGVSNLEEEPAQARTEFVMAVVGPLTSLVLGAIFFVAWMTERGSNTPTEGVLLYLALTNGILGIFNLIPGFPLDGGRVLRAIIWGATRNLRKATVVAATVGRYFGWAFIGFGVFLFLWQQNFLGGLWMAFIGWFISSAADSSLRDVTMRERLAGVHVSDVMDSSPVTVPPGVSVEDLISRIFVQKGCRAVPVEVDRRLKGIATLDDVKKVERERWKDTPVEKIMTAEPLLKVKPDDDLSSAMQMLAQHGINQLPVVREGDEVVGMICRADVIRRLQVREDLSRKR